jgi:hypothetical protein
VSCTGVASMYATQDLKMLRTQVVVSMPTLSGATI